jgi:hypothetical protein
MEQKNLSWIILSRAVVETNSQDDVTIHDCRNIQVDATSHTYQSIRPPVQLYKGPEKPYLHFRLPVANDMNATDE